ncbi:MAG: hypothetical protein M3Q79_02245 [bacterium]|nr:hypothetical protein [bacterium]
MTEPFYSLDDESDRADNNRVSGRKIVASAILIGLVLSVAEKVEAGDRIIDGAIDIGKAAVSKILEVF